tara:strand:+ start:182 stop:799 length:618 start_codon:yes stop_codon:yes gene_type:complete
MNRNEKRSSRLLALQLMYANEISDVQIEDFFEQLFNILPLEDEKLDKHAILSILDIKCDMALSILPKSFCEKFNLMRKELDKKNENEIISAINNFQDKLNRFKKNIQKYALQLVKVSMKNVNKLDNEIISRSKNWDSERITLMDKLILRLVIAEILFIDHVPPKVSMAEGIEIAKTMSTKDSSAFVNGILDSFYNDWSNKTVDIN